MYGLQRKLQGRGRLGRAGRALAVSYYVQEHRTDQSSYAVCCEETVRHAVSISGIEDFRRNLNSRTGCPMEEDSIRDVFPLPLLDE